MTRARDVHSQRILYKGMSMNPTFFNNDILFYESAREHKIRKGDIILFRSPGSGPISIHRVILVRGDAILTRGDNNYSPDPMLVSFDQVMGKVIAGNRAGNAFTVKSGTLGYLVHYCALFRRFLLMVLTLFLKDLYYALSDSKLLFPLTRGLFKTRFVTIHNKDGTDLQLYNGNRLIAWKLGGSPNWDIRPPFRLFLDPESLLREQDKFSCSLNVDNVD